MRAMRSAVAGAIARQSRRLGDVHRARPVAHLVQRFDREVEALLLVAPERGDHRIAGERLGTSAA